MAANPDIRKSKTDPEEYEFERHDPRFGKHDVKVKRNNRRAKPNRHTLSVRQDKQEER
jgi:hypothetical protein